MLNLNFVIYCCMVLSIPFIMFGVFALTLDAENPNNTTKDYKRISLTLASIAILLVAFIAMVFIIR